MMSMKKKKIIESKKLLDLFDRKTIEWHKVEPNELEEIETIDDAILKLLLRNFQLWHTEDEARRKDVPDSCIADCKRKIDKLNQSRQDIIEKCDELIILIWPWVSENSDLPMNTETPGSVIDRLSVASLKMFHMKEQTLRTDVGSLHIAKCNDKLNALGNQRKDLALAFDQLIEGLCEHRKKLKVYRQFKMYNDPSLNPAMYGVKRGA